MGKITIFNSQVFSKTRYHAPLMLRGIYFTSIDEVKEKLSDDLATKGLPSVSVASSSDMPKGMFLPRVFERIILSESTLVKIDDKFKKKFGRLQALLIGLLFISIVGLISYWSMYIVQENKEVRSIEETIRNYNSIKSNPIPNLTLKRVGSKKEPVQKIEQIGQLGGRTGSSNVNFLSNDTKLSAFAKVELKVIAEKIKSLDPTTHIKIFGYTDNVGDVNKNLLLSYERAKSIKAYFVSKGVEESRIISSGKGSGSPIATNDTVEGRSLNRRVEIFAYGVQEYTKKEPTYKESYKVKYRPEEWREVIATLETLCDIGADDEHKVGLELWKPGFYKVAERNEWVTKLYHQTLNSILLDRVALIIKRELLNNLEDREKTNENLKAYLLLNNEKRRVQMPDYLKQYMLQPKRWGNLSKEQVKKLNKHLDTLLNIKMRKVVLDEKAIKRARTSIMTKSGAAGLYYKTLKEVASRMNLTEFQFNQVLASNPQAIRGGEFPIAGIYTKKGYLTVILPNSKSILKEAIEENWVLNKEESYSDSEFKYLHKQILNLYFADYRKKWSRALAKISIPKYVDPKDLTEQLALFSSPASPIVDILRAVKKNTYLLTQQEIIQKQREEDKTGIAGKVGKKLNILSAVKDPHAQYKIDLRASFKGYHKLIDRQNLPSRELMPFQTRMEEVYAQVLMVDTAREPSKRALEIVKDNSSQAHSSFELKHSFVPLVVRAWYNGMLQQNWEAVTLMAKGQINKEFITEIWDDYSKKIANRFPLNPKAKDAIEMEDFVAFFGKDGILDNFYKKNLFPFIQDINYNTRTYEQSQIDGSSVSIDKSLIDSMFNAKAIQELMFDEGGVALEIGFNLTAIKMADIHSTMEVQYEDQLLLYEHGPKVETKFQSPGASKTSLAKFTLYDFELKRVVKVRGRDEWALLRLLYQLNPKVTGKDVDGVKVKLSYKKDSNNGSIELKGKSSNIFSDKSPLLSFKLHKKSEK
jgi:type VI secretion system protein ImpL